MSKILITGAGSGLGKAASIALCKRGHYVYATTHRQIQADELNDLALKNGLNLKSFKLDICLKQDRLLCENLDIDVLINNAAIGDSGSTCEAPINNYRNVFETNVFSTLELTQIALKNMIRNKNGRIIFISSLAGRVSIPFLSPYTSSKFALEAIATSLKSEVKSLSDCKIDVILIEPGAYATGFNQKNIHKQFLWMRERSYFKNNLNKIEKDQYDYFSLVESKSLSSIVNQYIKSVEDKHPKFRYSAPLLQSIFVQGQRMLGK